MVEDFNRDGFADVVISSFEKNSNIKAYVYKGSETVLGKPFINTVINDMDKTGYFGISFAVEKFERPGILNLIINNPDKIIIVVRGKKHDEWLPSILEKNSISPEIFYY